MSPILEKAVQPTVKIDGVEMGNDGRLRLRSVEKGKGCILII